jgi:CRISPR-associated protein Cmr1
MQTITATYRVVTPMFLGGAEPSAEAELRLPSFKGALRFWWRALMWGKGFQDPSALLAMENKVFGCSSQSVGQSACLMRIEMSASPNVLQAGKILGKTGEEGCRGTDVVGEGARYLGYGLMEAFDGKNSVGGRLTRACLVAPFEFELHLQFKHHLGQENRDHVIEALKLLGLCAGLGSRSRRGFGSLTLTHLRGMGQDDWKAPTTPELWESSLRAILGDMPAPNALPEWTSFASAQSQVLVVQGRQEAPLELLARLGRDFVFFRSWGKNGKVLGLPREGNFKADHDLMRPRRAPNPNMHPRRIVFGLPHNYGKQSDEQVGPADRELDRRASPLLFHIHQPSPTSPPLGVLLFLPSRFLPPNRDQISVGGVNVPLAHQGTGEFWKPVHDFLERVQNGNGKEQFLKPRLIKL